MTEPQPPQAVGSQAERTALAWSRTLIGLSAVMGFLAVHASLAGAAPAPVVLIGLLAAVTLISSTVASRRRWTTASQGLAGTGRTTTPLPLALLSASTVVLAAASFVIVIQDWR